LRGNKDVSTVFLGLKNNGIKYNESNVKPRCSAPLIFVGAAHR